MIDSSTASDVSIGVGIGGKETSGMDHNQDKHKHHNHHHHGASSHTTTTSKPTPDYILLRKMTATYLREHIEECCPFLGMLPTDPEYLLYCNKVESIVDAEWGGQLEIRALCECLHMKIIIYNADSPLVIMGKEHNEGDRVIMGEEHNEEDSGCVDSNSTSTVKPHHPHPPLMLTYHKHYYTLGEHYNSVVPITENCSCSTDRVI